MRLFDWLRPHKCTNIRYIEFEHTAFGTLKFDSDGAWYGWDYIDACFKGSFSIAISGNIDGPFPGSVEAYSRLKCGWLDLRKPSTHLLTQNLVRHFSDAPKGYFVHGNLWSHTRLSSMHLTPNGGFKLWFQFDFQPHWEFRYIVVEVCTWSITNIENEINGKVETTAVQ